MPIGLAVSAALSSHCAAVHTRVATRTTAWIAAHALVTALTVTMIAARAANTPRRTVRVPVLFAAHLDTPARRVVSRKRTGRSAAPIPSLVSAMAVVNSWY